MVVAYDMIKGSDSNTGSIAYVYSTSMMMMMMMAQRRETVEDPATMVLPTYDKSIDRTAVAAAQGEWLDDTNTASNNNVQQ